MRVDMFCAYLPVMWDQKTKDDGASGANAAVTPSAGNSTRQHRPRILTRMATVLPSAMQAVVEADTPKKKADLEKLGLLKIGIHAWLFQKFGFVILPILLQV